MYRAMWSVTKTSHGRASAELKKELLESCLGTQLAVTCSYHHNKSLSLSLSGIYRYSPSASLQEMSPIGFPFDES